MGLDLSYDVHVAVCLITVHKQFCTAFEKLNNDKVWYSCNGKESEWNKRKIYHMQLLAAALDRDLTSYESNAWLIQPKCHVCFRTSRDLESRSALILCPNCHVVFCCSNEHWEQYRSKHKSLCQTYQIMVQCEKIRHFGNIMGPEEWDESYIYPPLPKDWNYYLKWRKAPQFNQLDAIFRVIANTLSVPLTILSALERFYSRNQLRPFDDLVIHLVGAGKYEVFLYNVVHVVLRLIENEFYSLHSTSYDEYSVFDDFITPQIVVDEANQNVKMLKDLDAKIIVGAKENKWGITLNIGETIKESSSIIGSMSDDYSRTGHFLDVSCGSTSLFSTTSIRSVISYSSSTSIKSTSSFLKSTYLIRNLNSLPKEPSNFYIFLSPYSTSQTFPPFFLYPLILLYPQTS
ncbi:putative MYND domain protein [Gigaspora margarita]|uniref:Putative MYND domain protein n=1 Tax=Gigaspora margarita TaxID=4874 RepID=A0A8H4B242_GIGMA|nr:putative MYND domain protein [Gigaspora margarita]